MVATNFAQPWVLGIAASHNGGACLMHGDQIVVAIQEERLSRHKRARVFGKDRSLSVRYCLDTAGIDFSKVDAVGFTSPLPFDDPTNSVHLHPDLGPLSQRIAIISVSHHRAHAIAAVATSGFAESAVLVIDGAGSPFGDLEPPDAAVAGHAARGTESISIYHADRRGVTALEKDFGSWLLPRVVGMPMFGSLGSMYSAVSQQIFGDPMEAGKVMGLAPYGRATIPVNSFVELNGTRCTFPTSVPRLYNHDVRWPDLREEYVNLAAGVQQALSRTVTQLARAALARSGSTRLCYAGGVALNCTANELLFQEFGVDNVSIMAAAEDNGTAIGAAYAALWTLTDTPRRRALRNDSMGKKYSNSEIEVALKAMPGVSYFRSKDPSREAAQLLAGGNFVGWFEGGSEFGPRSLGQRSILADPRQPNAKDRLNAEIKGREAFRPFAPVLPIDSAPDWFVTASATESPFMLRACRWREGAERVVPAVVHVDGTGRLQTVTAHDNESLWRLVTEFGRLTGVPVVLNTSFNLAGDPIVETPLDALICMLASGLSVCIMGDFVIEKSTNQLDFSRFHVVSAIKAVQECRVESGFVKGPVVRPSELGLQTPLPMGSDDPHQLLARIPGPQWSAIHYSVAKTHTPWGSLTQVIDVPEGELLRSIPGGGMPADLFIERLSMLPTTDAGQSERRMWGFFAARLIELRPGDGQKPSMNL